LDAGTVLSAQAYCERGNPWLKRLRAGSKMGSPYDLSSGGGFKALALMDKAQLKRGSAKHLRATAAVYTDEQEWVRKSRSTADRLEREAEVLERMARGG